MADTGDDSRIAEFRGWILRAKQGDRDAWDRLLRSLEDRLRALVHKLLGSFPAVARREQTGDMLSELWLDLNAALTKTDINDPDHFLRLAAQHLRWRLVDLVRRYSNHKSFEGNHATGVGVTSIPASVTGPVTAAMAREKMDIVEHFVSKLDPQDRELIDLVYFLGLTHKQAAQAVGRDERTVRRRLGPILVQLQRVFAGSRDV